MGRTVEYREVVNNSDQEYVEEFRGKEIKIPPRGSIVLPRRDAVMLMAQYVPFDQEKSSGDKPLSWRPAAGKTTQAAEAPKFVNNANGREFSTQEALDEDLKQYQHLKLKKGED